MQKLLFFIKGLATNGVDTKNCFEECYYFWRIFAHWLSVGASNHLCASQATCSTRGLHCFAFLRRCAKSIGLWSNLRQAFSSRLHRCSVLRIFDGFQASTEVMLGRQKWYLYNGTIRERSQWWIPINHAQKCSAFMWSWVFSDDTRNFLRVVHNENTRCRRVGVGIGLSLIIHMYFHTCVLGIDLCNSQPYCNIV